MHITETITGLPNQSKSNTYTQFLKNLKEEKKISLKALKP